MALEQRLRNALENTAREFNRALYTFDPTLDRSNTYPERMVSYYFIKALAQALPRAKVLLEIPIKGRSKRGWDNHVDALVFNDRESIVAEFKVAWAPEHWLALAQDLERLRTTSVAKEIQVCFDKAGRQPARKRRPYIFLGADIWRPERAEAWKRGSKAGNWVLPKAMLASRQRDYVRVYPDKGTGFDGYYLTWALFDFNEMVE